MNAQEFRKKPVVISAVQWTGNNLREIITFTDGPPETRSVHAGMAWETYEDLVRRDGLKIFTLEGMMNADIGDWIIKGVKGEHYPCKPDIFAATYEDITGKGVMPDATSDVRPPATSPGVTAGAVGEHVVTRLTIEPDMTKVREMLDAAEAKWLHLDTIAATIRVNTLRHGGTHEQADAFVRGEGDFVAWLSAKVAVIATTPPTALDDPRVRKLVEALREIAAQKRTDELETAFMKE